MNILVFGKDGQLGRALHTLFESKGGLGQNPHHHIQYVGRAECDLSQLQSIRALLDLAQPNCIINAAAYTAVDQAQSESALAYAINAHAPGEMARYAAEHGATLLHYSTDYVFDGVKPTAYCETDARNPLSIYGKSKAAGEEAIENAFSAARQGQFAIFRTSWVYGAGNNFIRTILRLARERANLNVVADQYGIPTSADWLAQVSMAFLFDKGGHPHQFISGVYHVVPAGELSWHALACWVVKTATEAGAVLKLTENAIAAIPAVEYPLPAPRPMNSRMRTDTLLQQMKAQGDVSKSSHSIAALEALWNRQWQHDVEAYVRALVNHPSL